MVLLAAITQLLVKVTDTGSSSIVLLSSGVPGVEVWASFECSFCVFRVKDYQGSALPIIYTDADFCQNY